jgi:hypothetical protein
VSGLQGIDLASERTIEVPAAGAKSISVQVRVPPESGKKGSNQILLRRQVARGREDLRPRESKFPAAMKSADLDTGKGRPWYREPWPWILAAGPFIVVIAGIYTAWLAIKVQRWSGDR